jgi:hypothetical protein
MSIGTSTGVSTVAAIGAVEEATAEAAAAIGVVEATAVAVVIGAPAATAAERIRGDGAERRVSLIVAPSRPAL